MDLKIRGRSAVITGASKGIGVLLQSDLQRKVSMFTWLPELWQRSKQPPLN